MTVTPLPPYPHPRQVNIETAEVARQAVNPDVLGVWELEGRLVVQAGGPKFDPQNRCEKAQACDSSTRDGAEDPWGLLASQFTYIGKLQFQ